MYNHAYSRYFVVYVHMYVHTYMYLLFQLFSHLPEVSLECSSNVLQIHTCIDSCVALRDLLVYLASDGDLREQQEPSETRSRRYSGLPTRRESPRSSLHVVRHSYMHYDLKLYSMEH